MGFGSMPYFEGVIMRNRWWWGAVCMVIVAWKPQFVEAMVVTSGAARDQRSQEGTRSEARASRMRKGVATSHKGECQQSKWMKPLVKAEGKQRLEEYTDCLSVVAA
ncbi:hypothetical protein DFP72DRAFT_922530 [Ephemerocybe angulata]|uniref:Uncharacterized protein n=1 Tax=Ephemerocybe angulata TaxID=980116 RepID=A0A8H6HI02_9AGAR|nr:hypothetical protein DFP72DRAFT_922530 [Tulosesus angulatus]